jgi:hypothetical protein
MLECPSAEALATLVSGVTETMFGFSFELAREAIDEPGFEPPAWRTAAIPIGTARFSVAIASDQPTGQKLAGLMFGLEPQEVDDGMGEDALRELVNIIAGRVKSSMGVDEALGLPKLVAHVIQGSEIGWRTATLHGKGRAVVVWVGIFGSDLHKEAAHGTYSDRR